MNAPLPAAVRIPTDQIEDMTLTATQISAVMAVVRESLAMYPAQCDALGAAERLADGLADRLEAFGTARQQDART